MQTVGNIRQQVIDAIGSAHDARLLMSLMLDCQPAMLSMHSDRELPQRDVLRILEAAERVRRGKPLAYCAGRAPFRHLVLAVDERVLIPRPETEILVDVVLRIVADNPGGTALDIGTGSGAIALALATESRFDRIIATDISRDALDVAAANHARLGVLATPVEFRHGASLAPVQGERARVLASNPPYIAYQEATELDRSVRDWEPPLALFADAEGMAMYETLLAGAPNVLERAGWIVLEVDARRAEATAARAEQTGHYSSVELVPDLTGRQRVLVAQVAD
jgi:release factor glutamine methyltransferase